MGDDNMNFYRVHLDSVDSTNRYIRDEAANLWRCAHGADALLVTASRQSAGRGQRGNVWVSEGGSNLLATILVAPDGVVASRSFVLSQCMALAVHDAMSQYGIDVVVKWPNDIYVGNRKLAGILIELDYCGMKVKQALLGVGLNINQRVYEPMDRVPVSMQMLTGDVYDVDDVLTTLLGSFSKYYRCIFKGESELVTTEYMNLMLGYGEERAYIDACGVFTAVAEGVEPDGHLLLRRSDGTLSRYAFKEVEQIV